MSIKTAPVSRGGFFCLTINFKFIAHIQTIRRERIYPFRKELCVFYDFGMHECIPYGV